MEVVESDGSWVMLLSSELKFQWDNKTHFVVCNPKFRKKLNKLEPIYIGK